MIFVVLTFCLLSLNNMHYCCGWCCPQKAYNAQDVTETQQIDKTPQLQHSDLSKYFNSSWLNPTDYSYIFLIKNIYQDDDKSCTYTISYYNSEVKLKITNKKTELTYHQGDQMIIGFLNHKKWAIVNIYVKPNEPPVTFFVCNISTRGLKINSCDSIEPSMATECGIFSNVSLDKVDILAADTSNIDDLSYMFFSSKQGQGVKYVTGLHNLNVRKVCCFKQMFDNEDIKVDPQELSKWRLGDKVNSIDNMWRHFKNWSLEMKNALDSWSQNNDLSELCEKTENIFPDKINENLLPKWYRRPKSNYLNKRILQGC